MLQYLEDLDTSVYLSSHITMFTHRYLQTHTVYSHILTDPLLTVGLQRPLLSAPCLYLFYLGLVRSFLSIHCSYISVPDYSRSDPIWFQNTVLLLLLLLFSGILF